MKTAYDTIIIGAGASGMTASIFAAREGRSVLLLEKTAKLGKKILLTGNGRCNISNKFSEEDQKQVKHYFGNNPKFVMSALNKFGYSETKEFFSKLGIEYIEEDSGRMFPASNQAQSVVDVLEYEMRELGVKIVLEANISAIGGSTSGSKFTVHLSDGREFQTPKLIVATGGKTLPGTGSTGDGYSFASQFGHTVIPQFPVYSGFNVTKESEPLNVQLLHKLQGTKLEVGVKAFAEGKLVAENEGTLMFAHYGLSAPGVLEISREVARAMELENKKVEVSINFFPGKQPQDVDQMLVERWTNSPNKTLGFSLVGLLPKKVLPAILEAHGINSDQKVAEISKEKRAEIVKLLTELSFKITSVRGYKEAHFTAGGVDTKEVNPSTLESKLIPGLYFAGEVLDVDGECGGYNLQWAWSSGAVAGASNK